MQWTNEALDLLRHVGDQEVDHMVDDYLDDRSQPANEMLGRMIRRELPPEDRSPEIEAWLTELPPPPEWACRPTLERGAAFFEEHGPEILLSLLLASLPECYAARKGVQVLHLTARLLSDPQRRLVETAQMVIDAMSLGGLEPGARGYNTIRRVRLMHAGIRSLITSDPSVIRTNNPNETRPHYSPEWGTPVNQEDLVGTLLTFSIVVLDALEKMGTRVSRPDAEAYMHTWNVVGHIIGVRPDLLPIGLDDGRALMKLIRTRQNGPCKEGKDMTAAVLTFARQAVRVPWLQGLPATTIRHLIGPRTADIIGVPPADWTAVMLGPIAQAMQVVSFFGQRQRLIRLLTADFNRALIEALLVFGRGGNRPPFDIPTHLADRWGVRQVAVPV
jgi:mpaB/rubber oxygenase-like protein